MRLLTFALLTVALGCSSPFGPRGTPCGEFRNTSSTGAVTDGSAASPGRIELYLNETRDTTRRPDLVIQGIASDTLTGGPLRGHIVAFRLLDGSGKVLAEDSVELASTLPHAWFVSQNVLVSDAASLRTTIIAGQLRVELTTDDAPARKLIVPMHIVMAGDWYTLRCL